MTDLDPFSFFTVPTEYTAQDKAAKSKTIAYGCNACPYNGKPGLKQAYGKGGKGILFILEHATEYELSSGKPLQGTSANLLHELCNNAGVDLYNDAWVIYASPCGPDADRKCIPNIEAHIANLKPSVIVPLGFDAIDVMVSHALTGRMKSTKPGDFIGCQIPDRKWGYWICPTYAPSYIASLESKKNDKRNPSKSPWRAIDLRGLFVRDLKEAIAHVGREFPDTSANIETVPTLDGAIAVLEALQSYRGVLSHDYETTGLKPHRDGHYIACVAITIDSEDDTPQTYSMPFFRNSPRFMELWGKLMANPKIKKVAHNIQFENMWNYVRGSEAHVAGWFWDTAIAQHVIHNARPTTLKYCAYVNLGVAGYDDEMDEFISATKEEESKHGANAINRIANAPMGKMLGYCGLDSHYSHILQRIQAPEIRKAHNRRGFKLFMAGAVELSHAQCNGFAFDVTLANRKLADIAVDMVTIADQIYSMPEMAPYQGVSLTSNQQLIKLLYDDLKYTPSRHGRKSTGDALQDLHTPLTDLLAKYTEMATIRGYITGYVKECVNGRIHGGIGLTTVRTFRSSSQNPNMQNIPKHNAYMKAAARSCYVPSPGNELEECDFKGAEVACNACVNQDPNLLTYVRDWKTTDMHRDVAHQMYLRDVWAREHGPLDGKLAKKERQSVKGPFTFAEFYGMTVNSGVAEGTWYGMPGFTMEWVKSQGLDTLEKWKAHMQRIEDDFWGVRFAGYQEWKYDVWRELRENLYIDQPTGFRCHAPMDYNQCTNILAQGSAFHWNLCIITRVAPEFKRLTNGRSFLVGQIHDSTVWDRHPEDKVLLHRLLKEALEAMKKEWAWIIVPLIIETERTAQDRPWNELEEDEMIVVE